MSTHEVRVDSMRVRGSQARCTPLVLDELSNDVIVGLDWQRLTNLTITPGRECDLLHGQTESRAAEGQYGDGQPNQRGAGTRSCHADAYG